ncbi:ribonuclease H2, subunit C [Collybia nuda]|uniref:Ribonuclease H2, subunit C n=1 Tax=Collybia nuda TaxID=64659 RepID=A0A9P5YA85_9AGAR|nr:ribonuclease H2, subunit C [Collybia nuda]
MPFHIDYNGKAPISKYLRVEPASEVVGAPEPEPEPEPEPAKSESDTELKLQENPGASSVPEPTVVATDEKSPAATLGGPSSPSFAKRVRDTATRFISTFRGRTIQGLKVDLPPGYIGLVLKAEADDTIDKKGSRDDRENKKGKAYGKRKARPASTTGRVTRSSTRVIDVDEEMDADMDIADGTEESRNEETGAPPDQIITRTLVPISQFSNFIIWNPDMPVDATRDEYIRSLTEWTRLAHEIHKVED